MTLRYLFAFFIGLILGYGAHLQFSKSKQQNFEEQLKESQQQTKDLKAQIQSFKSHIDELSAGSSDKTAEEILGKMMQIFLADLSLRIKAPNSATIAGPPPPTNPPLQPQTTHASSAKAESKQEVPPTQNTAPKRSGALIVHEIEKKIANSRNEQEALENLGSTRIENFFEVLSQAKPMDQKSALVLEGNFVGQTKPFDLQKRVVSVQMNVQLKGSTGNSSPQGTVQIIESKEGKVFSHSRGQGSLKSFSMYEGSTMIAVEHNGGDSYFQLYYSSQGDFFAGNDYEKVSASKYIPVGTIILQRSR